MCEISVEEAEEVMRYAEENAKNIAWNRKIDIIYLHDGKMKVLCTDGNEYTGICIGDCLGTDADGEDVDGIRFMTDSGEEIDLIEDEILKVEFVD